MNSVFNEFGVPNKAVNDIAYDIERLTKDFFNLLANEGYPISEIRAVGGVFVQAIDCSVAEAMKTAAHEKCQEARRNADSRITFAVSVSRRWPPSTARWSWCVVSSHGSLTRAK